MTAAERKNRVKQKKATIQRKQAGTGDADMDQ